jgi:hypothetical protein
MDTLISLPKLEIDPRGKLYYNKYKYRAHFSLMGAERLYGIKTMMGYLRRLEYITSDLSPSQQQPFLDSIDLNKIELYLNWRNQHIEIEKIAMARIEKKTISVFSNDLSLLTTLNTISKNIEYSTIDETIPEGIKYFAKKPKHNFRIYFKSKRVSDKFRHDLHSFIKRYENTSTVIEPSGGLSKWLRMGNKYTWRGLYIYNNYFIDFDQESTISLLGIMFGDMFSKKYKLEERPDK